MQSRLNPYLNFQKEARQAMEFYRSVFGGKLDMTTFKEGGMSQDPSTDNQIMHSVLEADNGMMFMSSDTPPGMPFQMGGNVSMSLSGDNESELRGYWDKLLVGGSSTMPLEKAPWGDTFGTLTDKFGIKWMVNISGVKA